MRATIFSRGSRNIYGMFWGGEVFRGYEQLFKLGDIGNLCGRNRMYRPIYPIAKEHY